MGEIEIGGARYLMALGLQGLRIVDGIMGREPRRDFRVIAQVEDFLSIRGLGNAASHRGGFA